MSYSLNTTVINVTKKQKPENAVILCHGYGGDGKDISILANYWKNYLPKTVFICPDAVATAISDIIVSSVSPDL